MSRLKAQVAQRKLNKARRLGQSIMDGRYRGDWQLDRSPRHLNGEGLRNPRRQDAVSRVNRLLLDALERKLGRR
jgi:hypothetical protein